MSTAVLDAIVKFSGLRPEELNKYRAFMKVNVVGKKTVCEIKKVGPLLHMKMSFYPVTLVMLDILLNKYISKCGPCMGLRHPKKKGFHP